MRAPPRERTAISLLPRDFGRTGLKVSALGFGAGHIGSPQQDDGDVARLLHGLLDLGITLIDTARGYGLSEERIGRHLAGRRDEFVLSTKGGYGVEGTVDWTGESISRGVERALRTLNTDRIDIFHLHSCPLDVLQRDDILEAVRSARESGMVLAAAYSGDNEELAWAAQSGVFDSLQTSLNVFDQWSLKNVLPLAAERGLGVIAKRPVANVAWQYGDRPVGRYAEPYWERLKAMQLDPGMDWMEFTLRFAAFAPGLHSIIAGTGSLDHLRSNAESLARGPLPQADYDRARAAFDAVGATWRGEV